jgi:hypothetical protein
MRRFASSLDPVLMYPCNLQVGINDACAIEEGFTDFILRHGAMAQRAAGDLVEAV